MWITRPNHAAILGQKSIQNHNLLGFQTRWPQIVGFANLDTMANLTVGTSLNSECGILS